MLISQIDWKKIKPKIGRWVRTEAHAGQITYSLEKELDDPFVITQFVVDFENETVSNGWREELYGHQEEVPLTAEEEHEAMKMFIDCQLVDIEFHIRPGELQNCESHLAYLGDVYDISSTKIKDNKVTVHGNLNNIRAAVADGMFDAWAEEDPEVEADVAAGVDRKVAGNWDY